MSGPAHYLSLHKFLCFAADALQDPDAAALLAFVRARRWALALRPEHHPGSDQSGHVEQPGMQDTLSKGTARAAQLAASAVTATAG